MQVHSLYADAYIEVASGRGLRDIREDEVE